MRRMPGIISRSRWALAVPIHAVGWCSARLARIMALPADGSMNMTVQARVECPKQADVERDAHGLQDEDRGAGFQPARAEGAGCAADMRVECAVAHGLVAADECGPIRVRLCPLGEMVDEVHAGLAAGLHHQGVTAEYLRAEALADA